MHPILLIKYGLTSAMVSELCGEFLWLSSSFQSNYIKYTHRRWSTPTNTHSKQTLLTWES